MILLYTQYFSIIVHSHRYLDVGYTPFHSTTQISVIVSQKFPLTPIFFTLVTRPVFPCDYVKCIPEYRRTIKSLSWWSELNKKIKDVNVCWECFPIISVHRVFIAYEIIASLARLAHFGAQKAQLKKICAAKVCRVTTPLVSTKLKAK